MNHPRMQGWHYTDRSQDDLWHWEFRSDAEVERLRRQYKTGLVHFVPETGVGLGPGIRGQRAAGIAPIRNDLDIRVHYGFSAIGTGLFGGYVFAHEVGHNLGGQHDPECNHETWEEVAHRAFRPYAFGYTDVTSCAKREGSEERLLCPTSIMSLGSTAYWDDDPQTVHSSEPYFSSARHKPNGWNLGIAGEREVERVLHETVPVAIRSGEAPYRTESWPDSVNARWTGRGTVRVTWSAGWAPRSVGLALAEGANDRYDWYGPDSSNSSSNLTPVLADDGSLVALDVSGLRPAGHYRMSAHGSDGQTADAASDTSAFPCGPS